MPSASSRSRQIDKDFWKVAPARSTSFSKSAAAPGTMSAREIPYIFPCWRNDARLSPTSVSPRSRFPRETSVRPSTRRAKAAPASSLNARYRARLSFASVWDHASSPWNQASRAAPTSSLARAVALPLQRALQPRAGLAVVLAHVPEVRQGPCQPKSRLRIARGAEAPRQGSAQIVVLCLETIQPRPLRRPPRRPLFLLRKPQEKASVSPAGSLHFSVLL
jgi:hypothetical protein